MMLDEPYRFAEAVANRRDYIEDQLRGGSPVVGCSYADGVLLLTLGQGQQKLYEAYDRIVLGSVGHPTDIEKLRQAAIDLASVIGFNYSEKDVTLQQIVHFGLGPAVKSAFDDVIRSPYIARVVLAEVERTDAGSPVFYTVDYDGSFTRHDEGCAAIGDVHEADRLMQARLAEDGAQDQSLADALRVGLTAWSVGRWVGKLEEVPHEEAELQSSLEKADLSGTLRENLENLEVEAVVLDRSRADKSKFRQVTDEELKPVVDGLKA